VPDRTAAPDDDLHRYRSWTPQAQARALERLRAAANDQWRPFYCPDPHCDGAPHGEWPFRHARSDQRPPQGSDWLVWALAGGRGAGKTRTGSEYTHRVAEHIPWITIVAATGGDLRDVVVEGESGLLATAPPGRRPQFEPSKRRLTWPNGARALLASADEPDRLRGPQHGFAWLDEAAHYRLVEQVWSNLKFGLRLGRRPHVLLTTTPKPTAWMKKVLADPTTVVSRASTYANLDNLAPTFAQEVLREFEGTRLGRQELHAEMLTDVEGSLWTWELVEACRVEPEAVPQDFDRVVVAVDPAGSTAGDETGIVVAGTAGGTVYVLADRSGKYTPHGWSVAVREACDAYSADAVVAETNFGGDLVVANLRASGVGARVLKVHARRGKALRAEPVVGLFEQRRCLLAGMFPRLEDQLTTWVPGDASPDRLDAMVYAVTAVGRTGRPAQLASPLRLVPRTA
jgi:phage terminase large subunit-like protein